MIQSLLALIISLGIVNAFSQSSNAYQSKIEEVHVFFQGAEIKRSVLLNLQKGKNHIEIHGLSSFIDPASLNLSAISGASVLSAYIESGEGLKTLKEKVTSEQAKLAGIQSERENLESLIKALESEKTILAENAVRIGNVNGININDIDHTMNYFRKKHEEIIQTLNKKRTELTNLINHETQQTTILEKSTARLHIALNSLFLIIESEQGQAIDLHFSYYVTTCAWAPFYNIYQKNAQEELTIEYKANILNNSGEDWNEATIVLSPSNPATTLGIPQMNPWLLSYQTNVRGKYRGQNSSGSEGNLSKQQIKNGKTGEGQHLEMRAIEIEEGFLFFRIHGKHSIPHGNHAYKVEIDKFTRQPAYYYQAVPKLESKAYLIAMVTDWENHHLIEGEANVFNNNIYMGKSYIDPMSAGDTLEISLGPDPGIQITRVKKKDHSRRRLIGFQLVESASYEIDIRNLNKYTISIEILDQVPVAQQSDINVAIDEKNGASLTENIGKLTWKLEIPPVETARIKMGYSVRYPKDKIVIIKRSQQLLCPSRFW